MNVYIFRDIKAAREYVKSGEKEALSCKTNKNNPIPLILKNLFLRVRKLKCLTLRYPLALIAYPELRQYLLYEDASSRKFTIEVQFSEV